MKVCKCSDHLCVVVVVVVPSWCERLRDGFRLIKNSFIGVYHCFIYRACIYYLCAHDALMVGLFSAITPFFIALSGLIVGVSRSCQNAKRISVHFSQSLRCFIRVI